MAATFTFPPTHGARGAGFWLDPRNWIASRKKFRRDHTVEWRRRYESDAPAPPDRSVDFSLLTERLVASGVTFVILGDTGEGDRSQYGLLPLIRALQPDFIVINGDIAYPAGSEEDFLEGFFQPYQNLHVPIWATPGNHEYYSPHNGREFFDLFCTAKHAQLWHRHGLRHVPQPGTYWELSSPGCPLVVLGLDSGMTATLDPTQKLFGFVKAEGDAAQLAWLERRLLVAKHTGKKALVMFHIPALVNLERASGPKLDRLHAIFGRFGDTISAVVTAHEHTFQHYSPGVFARFVAGGMVAGPNYFVSGSGGAFLSPVEFDKDASKDSQYSAARLFPSRDQWAQHASRKQKAANFVGLARSTVARALHMLDHDEPRFQSLLQVSVLPTATGALAATMTPYFLDSLEELYRDQPDVNVIVRDGQPLPTPAQVEACIPTDAAGNRIAFRL